MKFYPDFYLDDQIKGDNLSRALEFIDDNYTIQGISIFGYQPSVIVPKFRKAVRGVVDNLSDDDVFGIIRFALMQQRNYMELVTFPKARLAWGWIQDYDGHSEQFDWCRFVKEKYFEVEPAVLAISTFVNLSLAEQRSILKAAQSRLSDPNFIDSVQHHMQWEDVIPGHLHFEGLGIRRFIASVLVLLNLRFRARAIIKDLYMKLSVIDAFRNKSGLRSQRGGSNDHIRESQ